MFSPPSGQAQPSNDLKRHCILITASNPYSLPTPVYRPKLQNPERYENGHAQSESRLSDAETVASYFSRVFFFMNSPCITPFATVALKKLGITNLPYWCAVLCFIVCYVSKAASKDKSTIQCGETS